MMKFEELLGEFENALRDIDERDELLWVLRLLNSYVQLMEEVQRLPWRLRLKYFAATFLVFNFLRLHQQLGRDDHPFSKQVSGVINRIFSTLQGDCLSSSLSCLKERKKRGEKKNSPHTPLIKEKTPEKIEKETLSPVSDAKEVFRKECLSYVGPYDEQQVADFYNYWSEASKRGTMRFERQKYWDTEKRLKRWCKNRYSSENTAAALRLERLKKKAPEQTAKREDDNARLEREIEERKRNAVSYEEWKKMKDERLKDERLKD